MAIKLHYTVVGSGEPLVLLHGNGESSAYFTAQKEFFSDYYRVIALDTRGHGSSPRGTKEFTLAQFVEDLKNFLDEQALTHINLLGFSDGGNIALLFALKYPTYIKKMILNGANLFADGLRGEELIPLCITYGKVAERAKTDTTAIAQKELLALMIKEPRLQATELAVLSMPVLVLAGTKDMVRDEHTRLIAASIPGAELCILPGDHFIAATASASFNAHVLAFLKSS